jgi:tRNA pseudouridine38-40 synthase
VTQRYFFEISYKGSHYSGWQRQRSAPSIQHTLEDTLTKVLRKPITIHGCGRTDAGVHASQYFFHLDISMKHTKEEILFKVNRSLPPDIVVHNMHQVTPKANAQKDATARTYQYFVHRERNAFLDDLSYFEHQEIDIEKIQEAISAVAGKHDFRFFCKSPDKNDNCICDLKVARLQISGDGGRMMFEFQGNRFLHNMIRLLVGNLLKIGRGALTNQEFLGYLSLSSQPQYFDIAYPNGLYLAKVEYPYLDVEARLAFPMSLRF